MAAAVIVERRNHFMVLLAVSKSDCDSSFDHVVGGSKHAFAVLRLMINSNFVGCISRKFDKLTQEPDLEATRRSPTVNVDVGSGVGGHPIVMYRWTGAKAARAS
jgi:hypothetical protein